MNNLNWIVDQARKVGVDDCIFFNLKLLNDENKPLLILRNFHIVEGGKAKNGKEYDAFISAPQHSYESASGKKYASDIYIYIDKAEAARIIAEARAAVGENDFNDEMPFN